jgi:ATP-dependent RNA helicase DbpA
MNPAPASPAPASFASLPLDPALLGTLAELGYERMTLVQAQALPWILAGRDVIARAKTGSGKTAAFGLGLLQRLDARSSRVQALVICPTRELADQVAKEIRRLARGIANVKVVAISGGTAIGPQIGSLEHSAHIVVGTPGRLLKHLDKNTLHLRGLNMLVLDEADRMLDMGFEAEIEQILGHLPDQRQTLLFSATYPSAIATVSARVQHDPVQVDVTEAELPVAVSQRWCEVTADDRDRQLYRALAAWGGARNLVFCNTKVDCARLANSLRGGNVAAVALHGDLDQVERTGVLVRFANGSASVLVATDVAARGLDIDDVDAVFNYELPGQPEVYVHRIGRTARAGKAGLAVSLVAARELPRLQGIQAALPGVEIRATRIPADGHSAAVQPPAMGTVEINGGRRNKLRPGDLLGTLTAPGGVPGESVGKIDLFDANSFVAVRREHVRDAVRQLGEHRIKGRQFRAREAGSTPRKG